MGQNVSFTTLSAGSAGLDAEELSDLSHEKSLGSARFMKCIRARHRHGLVVVKVVMKPTADFDFQPYVKEIRRERRVLSEIPNALGYQRIVKTDTFGYLVRQYHYSSLYDRMSTRPFLEEIEKKWLAFQLLCAVRDCHSRNLYHGDIKTENILVTSWNWLYLTDFSSSFKKTYLPEDNPADFSYFFDTSSRRTCYLAPERFLGAGEKGDTRGITWAMDVFSVGCVIAELFLEAPFLSLSQLFKYRKGDWDPQMSHLSKIDDLDIREMVSHMIQVEPESRYSAEEYLNFWRRKAFPEYFYSFLHQYMGLVTDPSSGRTPVNPESTNFGDADERIDRVYYDFDKISYFLGFENDKVTVPVPVKQTQEDILYLQSSSGLKKSREPDADDGTLIFLTLVMSSLRNTARSAARLHACDLLLAFGRRITDEAKLDRVLPYFVNLLADRSDTVRIAALRAMTQLLSSVTVVSPLNADIFPKYIIPRLQILVESPGYKSKPAVRATYATCLASLALTATHILDMVQALRADGSIPTLDPEAEDGTVADAAYQNLFDVARLDLVDHFEMHTKALLTDSESTVRRAFLGSVSSLCVFFGSTKANDVVLSHLNTYLNDEDWMLKCALFKTIVGVATFVGGSSLEDFILPLMVQALTDPEDFVVQQVLTSFASMAELGLFQRSKTWELVDVIARFMVHPNIWIKEAAAHFISAASRFLSSADVEYIIVPLIQPYLKYPVHDLTETSILDALKRPLSRAVLDVAATWAVKHERGVFWKPKQQQRTFSFGGIDQGLPTVSSRELGPQALGRLPMNDEDEQWIARLKNLGMVADDEFKLVALREYIGRMAKKKTNEKPKQASTRANGILSLEDMNVTRQTVFFENQRISRRPQKRRSFSHSPRPSTRSTTRQAHTIADALLDASSTIDDPLAQRKKAIANVQRGRTQQDQADIPPSVKLDTRMSSMDESPPTSSPGTRDSPVHPSPSNFHRPSLGPPPPITQGDSSNTQTLPPESRKTSIARDRSPGVRHKSSAINLLNRRETAKSIPETGTNTTNAVAKIDGLSPADNQGRRRSSGDDGSKNPSTPPSQRSGGHTYDGHDPNIIRLLDDLALESFPTQQIDYGPSVTPIRKSRAAQKADTQQPEAPWRPHGILVATFGEHTGPINRVLPSPDHVFFITASDDGTVKVWDTLRLERNLVHRSRHTHKHTDGSKVTCISFVERTHTFISCASDGSIHFVKVDVASTAEMSKYGKLSVLREEVIPDREEDEYALWCEQYHTSDSKPVLVIATNRSRLVTLDIRTMATLYTLRNPLHHGPTTCFVLDRKHQFVVVGTSRGILDLWDLRFYLHVKSIGLAGNFPIHRLTLHPYKIHRNWICVAGGTGLRDISVWDVEKGQCKEVFRANHPLATGSSLPRDQLRLLDPWNPDDEKPEAILRRFSTSVATLSLPASNGSDPGATTGTADIGPITLCTGLDSLDDGREARYAFFLTGGPDRKVRFWDVSHVENSVVVNGLDVDEQQASYITSHPTPSLTINLELVDNIGANGGGTGYGAGKGSRRTTEANSSAKRSGAGGSGTGSSANTGAVGGGGTTGVKPPRITIISKQQQALLRRHLDVIKDVALLAFPVEMVVSVDRAGVIYVFQ
ncbi:Serine/threonine-protein kinase [Agyrium rufum]|nr:Serine/threonine-protein kinase [Agyrium rufum]